jgi:hypothetical protein
MGGSHTAPPQCALRHFTRYRSLPIRGCTQTKSKCIHLLHPTAGGRGQDSNTTAARVPSLCISVARAPKEWSGRSPVHPDKAICPRDVGRWAANIESAPAAAPQPPLGQHSRALRGRWMGGEGRRPGKSEPTAVHGRGRRAPQTASATSCAKPSPPPAQSLQPRGALLAHRDQCNFRSGLIRAPPPNRVWEAAAKPQPAQDGAAFHVTRG